MSSKLIEDIQPGTPVLCNSEPVGEVQGIYSTGMSRLPEYLLVRWSDRAEATLVPSDEVMNIEERGVFLQSSREQYADLISFDPSRETQVHRLR